MTATTAPAAAGIRPVDHRPTLLTASGVNVVYEPSVATKRRKPATGPRIWAVRDVDLALAEGEFVGLVGESGCGKSTLGYALTRLLRPPARLDSGRIDFDGTDIASLSGEQLRAQRRGGFALVLQSGMNALNPVRTVEHHVADVLRAHGKASTAEVRRRAVELLESVQLDDSILRKFPHELSGGMRQRVSIALALALEPRLIVFDEPTTALDVMVQHAVMSTIKELQRSRGFTAVLISHDLGVVLDATDRVLVMYGGRIVEDHPSRELLRGNHHPYTEALLNCYADPRAEEINLGGIPGSPPDLSQPLVGCSFSPRCPLAVDLCRTAEPELLPLGAGRAACHVRAPGNTGTAPAESDRPGATTLTGDAHA